MIKQNSKNIIVICSCEESRYQVRKTLEAECDNLLIFNTEEQADISLNSFPSFVVIGTKTKPKLNYLRESKYLYHELKNMTDLLIKVKEL